MHDLEVQRMCRFRRRKRVKIRSGKTRGRKHGSKWSIDNNEDSLEEEEIDEIEEEEIDKVEEEETEEEEEEINQRSMERKTITTQNKESVDEPQKKSDKGERRSGRASRLPDKFRDFVLD